MQALTLSIALLGSGLIVFLRPVVGLCVYCATLFCYPQNLTVKIGTLDFSASRIVIVILLANTILRTRLVRLFKWNWLDTFVFLTFLGQSIALLSNVSLPRIMERQGGAFFDTVLPYLAARLLIRSKSDLFVFVRGLVLIGLVLAFSGAYQCVTGHNPVGFLKAYDAWEDIDTRPPEFFLRHGLYRADVTFGNYIGFGMFFAALAPMCLGLLAERTSRRLAVHTSFALMLVGVVSSMSSGPLLGVFVAISMVAAYPLRRFWIGILAFIVICCVFLEFYSNRHFYVVPTRLAFSEQTAYYRIGLYEEALGGGMRGHWLFGYGYVGIGPGNDNTNFHWEHRDFTSIYIGRLATSGLLGLIPLLALQFAYYRRLYNAFHLTHKRGERWLIWCFSSALVGWNVGLLTVSLVVQTLGLFYLLAAAATNMPLICSPARLENLRVSEPAVRAAIVARQRSRITGLSNV